MARNEGIGLGGVMAEVAWLKSSDKPVTETAVITSLCARYDISADEARKAIRLAEKSGVIERRPNKAVLLLPRPKNL